MAVVFFDSYCRVLFFNRTYVACSLPYPRGKSVVAAVAKRVVGFSAGFTSCGPSSQLTRLKTTGCLDENANN